MNRSLLDTVIRHAEALVAHPADPVADRDLVRRFVEDRDEGAFAELVRRHGPMVWNVCRHLLPNLSDAEDAFQATFLALVQSAPTVRSGASVGGWLHGVAVNVATKLRRSAVRQRQREHRTAVAEACRPVPDSAWDDLQTAVHEEVQRLPADLRTAFVLCDLEGVRQPDAAARLGWKPGTLTGRLTKARQQLLRQLTQRGIAPAAGAAGVGSATAGAVVPPGLCDTVMTLATAAGAASPTVSELARGVIPMVLNKTKLFASAALVVGGLSIGVGSGLIPTADGQGRSGGPPAGLAPGGTLPPGTPADPAAGGDMVLGAGAGYGPMGMPAGGQNVAPRWVYEFEQCPETSAELRALIRTRAAAGWQFVSVVDFRVPAGVSLQRDVVFQREQPLRGPNSAAVGTGMGSRLDGMGAAMPSGAGGYSEMGGMPGSVMGGMMSDKMAGGAAVPAQTIAVVPLKYANAEKVAETVSQLLTAQDGVTRVVIGGRDSLIVKGTPAGQDAVRELLKKLDVPPSGSNRMPE